MLFLERFALLRTVSLRTGPPDQPTIQLASAQFDLAIERKWVLLEVSQ
jgi:hypothetical protein